MTEWNAFDGIASAPLAVKSMISDKKIAVISIERVAEAGLDWYK